MLEIYFKVFLVCLVYLAFLGVITFFMRGRR